MVNETQIGLDTKGDKPKSYFEAEILKVQKDGVTIVLRGPWEMNGTVQPAALEIIEGKKPVKVYTKPAARVLAELSRKKIYQEFAEKYLGAIQDMDSLPDAEIS